MKTVLAVLCWLGVAVMLGSCSSSDSGSSGGGTSYPQVTYEKFTPSGGDERVRCFNADSNTITTMQICTWNCAYYNNSATPQKWVLTFDEALVCTPNGEFDDEGNALEDCSPQLAVVNQQASACQI